MASVRCPEYAVICPAFFLLQRPAGVEKQRDCGVRSGISLLAAAGCVGTIILCELCLAREKQPFLW